MSATYDVAIIGGGPAGSTCARTLVRGGARVVVIDREEFPRVKLCAGWLSPGIWDAMDLAPSAYPHGLWEWSTCHVHYGGRQYAIRGRGWFIRRYELDHFLLSRSGAEIRTGVHVKKLVRDADDDRWVIATPAGEVRARYVVGAGGTHCPVARMLAPPRPRDALGVQELELEADPAAIARARAGRDGEPELVLFDDIGGYAWNVPKTTWLNVGCGTLEANAVRAAWAEMSRRLQPHVPPEVDLDRVKGHSYFLYDPAHVTRASRDNALITGDALGLAHPITGEGILPAVLSGRHAAEAILAGDVAGYATRLERDPTLADYRLVHRLLGTLRGLRGTRAPSRIGGAAIAHGFGWMFSGAKLPMPRVLHRVLDLLPRGAA